MGSLAGFGADETGGVEGRSSRWKQSFGHSCVVWSAVGDVLSVDNFFYAISKRLQKSVLTVHALCGKGDNFAERKRAEGGKAKEHAWLCSGLGSSLRWTSRADPGKTRFPHDALSHREPRPRFHFLVRLSQANHSSTIGSQVAGPVSARTFAQNPLPFLLINPLLADWFLESSGSASLSAVEHPKLKNFLRQVGLPEISRADLAGARLAARFAEARANATARFREARFFQLVADGLREQLAVLEESYKVVCIDDPSAREIAAMVQNVAFWTEVEATHSVVKMIMDLVKEMETERPLVGQCPPLWEDLRGKVRGWCRKFSVEAATAMNVVERRFRKNYHPAWSAAFILDPLYLIKDGGRRYLPPFNYLTPEQEKDVDRLITRLVSSEEAHLVLMELMKWRSEGLDPLYAQAVQVRQPDPSTGKMKIANKQSSRLVWETCLSEFKSLGKVAVRLIFLHATAKGFKCTPSMTRWLTAPGSSAGSIGRAHRLVFIAANSKLERRDFSNDDDKDVSCSQKETMTC
uniref:Uncharacterized protein n=1 Tax=Aegilops tauschii TaxID=37682 RepID=N1QXL9_AEGTA